jgi:hypothetical protein
MVNVTDTFTKMYGRPPTQTELGAMMKLQANPEYVQKLLQPETAKKPVPKRAGIKCSKSAWATNCLMKDGYTKEQIAHTLCISIKQLEYNVNRYGLPRDNLIKPRE